MRRATALALLALFAAGCASPAADVASSGATEAALFALTALPVFGAPVVVAATGAGGVGGEPSLAVAPDGTIFVTAPFAPLESIVRLNTVDDDPGQAHVWRSTDGGASFQLLNDATGRLTPNEDGNGDTDVAVGPDGHVYVLDLGNGDITLLHSPDGGETWASGGALNADDVEADRQWIDIEGDLVVVTFANQSAQNGRGVDVTLSRDGGASWSHPRPLFDGIRNQGPVEIAPGGRDIYVPWSDPDWTFHLLASHDGGDTWMDHDAGHAHPRPDTLGLGLGDQENRRNPTVIFPVVAADAAGRLYLAMSDYREGDETTRLLVMRSDDKGASWSEPVEVAIGAANAIFPWIVAGDEGQVAIAYLASDLPLDPNKGPHRWRLEVAVARDADADLAAFAAVASFPDVHTGSICPKGGACRGGLYRTLLYDDRVMLDLFEMAVAPDGRLVLAWTQTEPTEARAPRIMFAAQTGGDGLAAR